MSATIGATGAPGYGTMDLLIGNAAQVRKKLDALTTEASTGLTAQTYGGLGSGARTSLDLSPQIAHATTWQSNIDAATGSMQVTQAAMKQIQAIAQTFYGDLPNLNNAPSSEIDSIAAQAQDALRQVANLLDTKNGDSYVFGGADSSNPPVPSPDGILSSGFYTQINTAVSGLAANGAAATIATTSAVASSNAAGTSPFSTYQSQAAAVLQPQIPSTQVGTGQMVQTGLLASANASAVSSGSSTSGSYMRDLMRALATIGSLSSSQASLPGFQTVIQDTTTSLGGAISAMATDAGHLGDVQTNLATTRASLSDTVTALTGQVSSVQDADMAAVLSQLQQVQTQMQSSYQLISSFSSLSLVKFLPVG